MLDQLAAIYNRYKNIEEQLADPELVADQQRYTKASKEYGKLRPIADAYLRYKELLENIETAEAMRKDPDPEMQEMAQMELSELNPAREAMEEELKIMLIPKDPEDERDVIVEIRSGAGGDEQRTRRRAWCRRRRPRWFTWRVGACGKHPSRRRRAGCHGLRRSSVRRLLAATW